MEHEIDQINVIPLVDVMLVLLVIVLTTATFISTGQIPIDLAKAKHAAATVEKPLVITLKPDGSVYVEAEGEEEDLLSFAAWCQHGPASARVDKCDIREGSLKGFREFTIER